MDTEFKTVCTPAGQFRSRLALKLLLRFTEPKILIAKVIGNLMLSHYYNSCTHGVFNA